MTEARVDYSTSVLFSQPPINTTEDLITPWETENAWRDQVAAVDRWEWLMERNAPQDDCEQAWEDAERALAHAEALEALYHDQCRCRASDLEAGNDH